MIIIYLTIQYRKKCVMIENIVGSLVQTSLDQIETKPEKLMRVLHVCC